MKISDEIRDWCEDTTPWPSRNDAQAIADRIDRELVELPKDADGVPIHVGDTVCECVSGMKLIVNGMRLTDTWAVSTNHGLISRASDVTHERPDSLDRIADDIEAVQFGFDLSEEGVWGPKTMSAVEDWCNKDESYETDIMNVRKSTLREWVDRIRKLSKEEE